MWPTRSKKIGGHYYPHRVYAVEAADEADSLPLVLIHASGLGVAVTRMSPTLWRFKPAGRGRRQIETEHPREITYPQLRALLN